MQIWDWKEGLYLSISSMIEAVITVAVAVTVTATQYRDINEAFWESSTNRRSLCFLRPAIFFSNFSSSSLLRISSSLFFSSSSFRRFYKTNKSFVSDEEFRE